MFGVSRISGFPFFYIQYNTRVYFFQGKYEGTNRTLCTWQSQGQTRDRTGTLYSCCRRYLAGVMPYFSLKQEIKWDWLQKAR